jgi:hypothetical protein
MIYSFLLFISCTNNPLDKNIKISNTRSLEVNETDALVREVIELIREDGILDFNYEDHGAIVDDIDITTATLKLKK